MRKAALSFDVEQDMPPYLDTWHGVEVGLPKILDLLALKRVKATFFFTAVAARKYPGLLKRVIDEGHEVGVHGYNHERLDKMAPGEACRAILKATTIVSRFVEPLGFRAPNLQLPRILASCLARAEYLYDSSYAAYKPPFLREPRVLDVKVGLVEVPVAVTSSILRLPLVLQKPIHSILWVPRVYFSHPWEYVELKTPWTRIDCRLNTGRKALALLEKLIQFLEKSGFTLVRIIDIVDTYRRNRENVPYQPHVEQSPRSSRIGNKLIHVPGGAAGI